MRPTYDLEAIKAAFGSVRALAITTTALRDAASLGYDRSVVSTIGGTDRRKFYKSMTTNADHRVWQESTMFPCRTKTWCSM